MKKLKLMTIVGTRPEIIKMSAIIKKADKYLDHVLVHVVFLCAAGFAGFSNCSGMKLSAISL